MTSAEELALPLGTTLQEYRIVKLLNRGGFGIVYLALDREEQPMAIKEYLPSALAARLPDGNVYVPNPENLSGFRHGMKCFFEEGRSLANIIHPNVVRVVNFFRANDTVYLVMVYERGKTLQRVIREEKQGVSENLIRRVFAALLMGLREVHSHKLLHLDIKPANIYIRRDGTPVLLDFGAARQTLAAEKPTLVPTYTPGFAAPEQYDRNGHLGPWTDIYAIGASMYACIAGAPPPSADERLRKDELDWTSRLGKGQYSEELLSLIQWCLDLDVDARPPSVPSVQKALLTPPAEIPRGGFWQNIDHMLRKLGRR